jgi:hypothetical protein
MRVVESVCLYTPAGPFDVSACDRQHQHQRQHHHQHHHQHHRASPLASANRRQQSRLARCRDKRLQSPPKLLSTVSANFERHVCTLFCQTTARSHTARRPQNLQNTSHAILTSRQRLWPNPLHQPGPPRDQLRRPSISPACPLARPPALLHSSPRIQDLGNRFPAVGTTLPSSNSSSSLAKAYRALCLPGRWL